MKIRDATDEALDSIVRRVMASRSAEYATALAAVAKEVREYKPPAPTTPLTQSQRASRSLQFRQILKEKGLL